MSRRPLLRLRLPHHTGGRTQQCWYDPLMDAAPRGSSSFGGVSQGIEFCTIRVIIRNRKGRAGDYINGHCTRPSPRQIQPGSTSSPHQRPAQRVDVCQEHPVPAAGYFLQPSAVLPGRTHGLSPLPGEVAAARLLQPSSPLPLEASHDRVAFRTSSGRPNGEFRGGGQRRQPCPGDFRRRGAVRRPAATGASGSAPAARPVSLSAATRPPGPIYLRRLHSSGQIIRIPTLCSASKRLARLMQSYVD